jgi:hypothetical protein
MIRKGKTIKNGRTNEAYKVKITVSEHAAISMMRKGGYMAFAAEDFIKSLLPSWEHMRNIIIYHYILTH